MKVKINNNVPPECEGHHTQKISMKNRYDKNHLKIELADINWKLTWQK
jgi:hypothetical protein